jgi:primase-like protein
VRAANLRRFEGLAIDIKAGKGAYVIAPPSVRPSTGTAYRFGRGGWDDLAGLPTFRVDDTAPAGTERGGPADEGGRNDHLFRRALGLARDCGTSAELALKVHATNEAECDPPLPWDEAERVAASA